MGSVMHFTPPNVGSVMQSLKGAQILELNLSSNLSSATCSLGQMAVPQYKMVVKGHIIWDY